MPNRRISSWWALRGAAITCWNTRNNDTYPCSRKNKQTGREVGDKQAIDTKSANHYHPFAGTVDWILSSHTHTDPYLAEKGRQAGKTKTQQILYLEQHDWHFAAERDAMQQSHGTFDYTQRYSLPIAQNNGARGHHFRIHQSMNGDYGQVSLSTVEFSNFNAL